MAEGSFVDKIKTQFTKISDLVKENETVKKVAGQVGVDPVALVGGGTVFVVLFTYFIFGVGLLCNLIGFFYPVYASLKAIESEEGIMRNPESGSSSKSSKYSFMIQNISMSIPLLFT